MSREDQLIRTGFGVLTESSPPAPSFDEIERGPLPQVRPNESHRWPRALTPILAAVAVLVVVGVPALLLGSNAPAPVGNTPPPTTRNEPTFSSSMQGWTLIAVLRLKDEPDVAVYEGPIPNADGKVPHMYGPGELFWPPRDRDGNPPLLSNVNGDPVELHFRPYGLVGGASSIGMADPLDLLSASATREGTVLERSEKVEIVDQARWEDFLAAVESSRRAREPDTD